MNELIGRLRLAGGGLTALLVGVATIATAGCGSASHSTSTTQSTASTGTIASTATGTSGTTAPGTALAVGATATVPYQPVTANQTSKPEFKLQVTVSAIEQGSLSDFNGIKLEAAQKASTPSTSRSRLQMWAMGTLEASPQ
jgi:hypothetical protein